MSDHPAPASESGISSTPDWIWTAIIIAALAIGLMLWARSCGEARDAAKAKAEAAAAEYAATHPAPPPRAVVPGIGDTLVLVGECMTPCTLSIEGWRFKIRTDGNPLWIKFQGVAKEHYLPAEGKVPAPDGVESGQTRFRSANDLRPHVLVQMYRVYSR